MAWLTSVVSLWNAAPAYPWGSKGHEIIAAIAKTQLNRTTPTRTNRQRDCKLRNCIIEAIVWYV